MVKAEDKKLARVQAMKAWVSGGIAPLIINLASDPCSILVEDNRQSVIDTVRVVGCNLCLDIRQST